MLAISTAYCSGCGSDGGSGSVLLARLLEGGLASPGSNAECGPLDLGSIIPDCPLGLVCFGDACEDHNQCYSSCRATKNRCDQTFLLDLRVTCRLRFPAGGADWRQCEELAYTYWLAVSLLGQEAYDVSQRFACNPGPIEFTPGACCLPDETCVNTIGPAGCQELGGVFFLESLCDVAACVAPANDRCSQGEPICDQPVEDTAFCEGTTDQPCSVDEQDCEDGSACVAVVFDEFSCRVVTDNRLATTDGPAAGGACLTSGEDSFQSDVWYRYEAPCTGRLIVRMCDTPSYDAMLAVYMGSATDSDFICPNDNEQLLDCDDDFCGPGSVSALTIDGVVAGARVTIRVGGWAGAGTSADASHGVSELDVTMRCDLPANGDGLGAPGGDDQPTGPGRR